MPAVSRGRARACPRRQRRTTATASGAIAGVRCHAAARPHFRRAYRCTASLLEGRICRLTFRSRRNSRRKRALKMSSKLFLKRSVRARCDSVKAEVLKDNVRSCDVCAGVIRKGEKYAVAIIPAPRAQLFRSLNESDPDMAATFTIDARGDVRLDICFDCKIDMGAPTTESVS